MTEHEETRDNRDCSQRSYEPKTGSGAYLDDFQILVDSESQTSALSDVIVHLIRNEVQITKEIAKEIVHFLVITGTLHFEGHFLTMAATHILYFKQL